jgi:hypothetical protein
MTKPFQTGTGANQFVFTNAAVPCTAPGLLAVPALEMV